jgi:hypothetical protein
MPVQVAGGVEKMKIYPSVLRVFLVPLTVAAFGVASTQFALADATNAAVPPPGGPTASAMIQGLPFGASEVIKMYQGGISKDVIVNYVENSVAPFRLTADNIIYLQNLGIPQEVTKAMLVRDGQLQQQAAAYAQQMAPNPASQMAMAPPPGRQQGAVVVPSTPPPAVYPDYSYSDSGYGYPYYPYYPYYGGTVVVGGWWPGYYGWGYRGGFRPGFGFHGPFGGFHGGFGGGFHGGGGGFHGGGGGGHGGGGGGHR